MKKVFFTLILLMIFANNTFANNDVSKYVEDCLAVISKPDIKITSSYGKLKYNFDKNEDFLRRETERKYVEQGQRMPDDHKPIGLTKVRQVLDFNMEVGVIGVSDAKYCVYPKKIDAHLGYSVPTIYILKGLEKGSCVYDVALRHEKTHMEIYIHALDYYLPTFKKSVYEHDLLQKYADRWGSGNCGCSNTASYSKRTNDTKEAESMAEKLNEDYLSEIKSSVNLWRKQVEEEQMKMDSIENYTLESRICSELDKK